MHARGFVHRDIKPANVFIRHDGSPVLLDFGSARQAVSGEARTLTNFVSPGYAPIEQYAGKSDQQGPWSDIYGLGATLYRAMTGHAPPDAVSRSHAIAEDSIARCSSASRIARRTSACGARSCRRSRRIRRTWRSA
jgi:serine/threonine protein kinase